MAIETQEISMKEIFFESHDINCKSDFGGQMLSCFVPTEFDVEK